MKRIKLFAIYIIIMNLFFVSEGFALQEKTHRAINETIAQSTVSGFSLDLYLMDTLGFSKGKDEPINGSEVYKWLGYGGEQEDVPSDIVTLLSNRARNNNHFHNPMKSSAEWSTAGLNDTVLEITFNGESLILWAQNPNQHIGGKWSWPDARSYFYNALTATSKAERERYFADTFRAAGQQMHLVQDASAPEHVRNDIHISAAYEAQVELFRTEKKYNSFWSNLIANPITYDKAIMDIALNHPTAKIPVARIIDADLYTGNNPDITKTSGADPQNPDPQYIGIENMQM